MITAAALPAQSRRPPVGVAARPLCRCRHCGEQVDDITQHIAHCRVVRLAFDDDYWPFAENGGGVGGRKKRSTVCRICGGPLAYRGLCQPHAAEETRLRRRQAISFGMGKRRHAAGAPVRAWGKENR